MVCWEYVDRKTVKIFYDRFVFSKPKLNQMMKDLQESAEKSSLFGWKEKGRWHLHWKVTLTPNMVKCVDVSKLQVFQRQLRTPEVTQTRKDSSKWSVSTRLAASSIGGGPPQHYTIEEEGSKSCVVVPPVNFWSTWIEKRDTVWNTEILLMFFLGDDIYLFLLNN